MSVRTKLILSFFTLYAIILGAGGTGFYYVYQMQMDNSSFATSAVEYQALLRLKGEVKQTVLYHNLFLEGKIGNQDYLHINDIDLKLAFSDMHKLQLGKSSRDVLTRMEVSYRSLEGWVKELKLKVGDRQLAVVGLKDDETKIEVSKTLDDLLRDSAILTNQAFKRIEARKGASRKHMIEAFTVLSAVAGISLILFLGFYWNINRSIIRPIRRLRHGIHEIGEGHWDNKDIGENTHNEFRGLIHEYNVMLNNLRSAKIKINDQHRDDNLKRLVGKATTDFDNVISAIIGVTTILKGSMSEDEAIVKQLDNVLESAAEGNAIIGKLRSYSEAEVTDIPHQPLELAVVVQDCIDLLEKAVSENIKIESDVIGEVWPVMADKATLINVILNMGLNAAESMLEGGVVSFKLKNIIVKDGDKLAEFLEVGPYNWLVVKDSGGGIPEESIKKVYEPFFTTKKEQGHKGMGLALVHEVIKGLEGHIYIDSVIGEGTSMHIFIPAVAQAAMSESTKSNEEAATQHA